MECIDLHAQQNILRTSREVRRHLQAVEQEAEKHAASLKRSQIEATKLGYQAGFLKGQQDGRAVLSNATPLAEQLVIKANDLLLSIAQVILEDVLSVEDPAKLNASAEEKIRTALHAFRQPDSPTWIPLRAVLEKELSSE